MSKQKMLAARELIQEKRYAEARALLKTIDDPKAKEWLKKLDAIAPEKKKSGSNLILVTTVVLLLAVVIIAVTLITRQNNADSANQNAVAQVPTQMELPSATPTPIATDTPQSTVTPTPLPTDTATLTHTPFPSNTPTRRPTNTLRPTQLPTASPGKWLSEVSVDPFDDTTTATLLLEADAPIRAWLSNPIPTLIVRCDTNVLDVFIHVDTQVEVEYGMYDAATARIRFDRLPARTITMDESTTGEALFFRNPETILPELLTHETLLFGFTPFNATPTETIFDLRGLNTALSEIRQDCSALQEIAMPAPTTVASQCSTQEMDDAHQWASEIRAISNQLAEFTSSVDIQNLRNDVAAVPYPPCLSTARQYMLDALDQLYSAAITATPSRAQEYFDSAEQYLELAEEELDRVIPASSVIGT